MLMLILEAALRSMLMALAVWAAIRMLRVRAVLAQKVAWVLVLVSAAVMPLVMHAPWLAAHRAVRIPVEGLTARQLQGRFKILAHRLTAKQSASAAITPAADGGSSAHLGHSSSTAMADSQSSPALRAHTVHKAAVTQNIADQSGSAAGQSVAGQSAAGQSVIDLPVFPIGISLKLPVALPARVGFWTASRIRLAVILLYAAVVGALLMRTIFGLAVAARILGRSRKIRFFSGSGQAMRVRSSRDLATPVTIGSTILLPADYAEWDAEKLRVVLAHEYSHVRQGDFYLQLAATVHAAIFWFSPLGWWLKHKLSDLGEALSDRAALEQAEDAASYAQVLLEFAAAPHRAPLAGVAMARSSNLSSRIERILNDSRFQLAFLGGRRHAILAAALVPVALVAAVAGFRIVPAVHAASANISAATTTSVRSIARGAAVSCAQGPSLTLAQTLSSERLQSSNAIATTIPGVQLAQEVVPVAPVAPVAPAREAVAPVAPEPPQDSDEDSDDSSQKQHNHTHSHNVIHSGDEGDSFSIVHRNGDGTMNWNGNYNDRILRAQKGRNLPSDYIWFERDGKSYVITDPTILSQADAMFRQDPALERQQKAIEEKQKVLEKQMAEFSPEQVKIKVDTPEFKKKMADLNAQIAKLQSDEFKKSVADLNKQINQEVLSQIQEQMGSIQEQIGQLQGQIGEEMGKFGEKQGELGEKMGELGEQMGRIGEEQGRRAEEATRKMQSVLDRALSDGKAKPVE